MMPTREAPIKKYDLFDLRTVVRFEPVAAKPTNECFTGRLWRPRTHDLCSTFGLSTVQPKADSCSILVISPKRKSAFVDWIAALLGVDPRVDISFMANEIIRLEYALVLPQPELIVRLTEEGVIRSGIRRDKEKNFFLVETGDPKHPVKMGCIFRDESQTKEGPWDSFMDELERGTLWPPESRFLLRNLDFTKFEH